MTRYFPQSSALASGHGWRLGAHHCRKIYANASFEIYEPRVKQLMNRWIELPLWIRSVLGHEGSLETTLSYSNVKILFSLRVARHHWQHDKPGLW